jgi:hypothetical protein
MEDTGGRVGVITPNGAREPVLAGACPRPAGGGFNLPITQDPRSRLEGHWEGEEVTLSLTLAGSGSLRAVQAR